MHEMYYEKKAKIVHLLEQIIQQLEIIGERCVNVRTVDDFLNSNAGMSLLDGICMKLIAVGESLKNLDKLTERNLLIHYPQIPWREVMGMRDIIVHHYFEIDADVIFATVQDSVPQLLEVLYQIKDDLNSEERF